MFNQALQHRLIRDMHDHGVPRRPLFRSENPLHSRFVESIRSQAVDGFSGQCHQAALAQDLGGLIEGGYGLRRCQPGRIYG